MRRLRRWLAAVLVGTAALACGALACAQSGSTPGLITPSAVPEGAVILFRHAIAPGTGDPPGFVLGRCETQRNLDAIGRAQAQRIGDQLKAIEVGAVWTSQWCRARDTARLAFPGRGLQEEPAFNSFFQEGAAQAEAQTAAARQLLAQWRGRGVLVVFTHQVNITALSGVVPASGEGVVMKWGSGPGSRVLGRLPAPS
jgi:phosphohistidine phosphatase SixA